MVDEHLESLTMYVLGAIYDEIQLAKGAATVAAAVARMANDDVAHQKRMLGLKNFSNFTTRVGDMKRTVGYLQTML